MMGTNLKFEKYPSLHQPDMRDGSLSNLSSTGSTTSGNMTLTTTTGSYTFAPMPSLISEPSCQWLLYADIKNTRIRIWDLSILIPNSLFAIFLIWTLRTAISKLRQSSSPIFAAFYSLVCLVSFISVLRCIVAMSVNATVLAGDIADKVLWLVLRFFLLGTELSVVVFGLAFGHLDSNTSIRRVLFVTTISALIYSCIQGTLEFTSPDPKFHVQKGTINTNYDIFAHGGMIFWMTSSAFFSLVYSLIFCLPYTKLKDRLNLPSKRSFYYYALFLAMLNCAQTVGSGLLYFGFLSGMCVIDATTFIYFTCFDPLVYGTFLREFFSSNTQSVPFSYKYQIDEGQEDDTLSLPYQSVEQKYPNQRDNVSDSGSFDSTHFDKHGYTVASINGDVYPRPGSYQNT